LEIPNCNSANFQVFLDEFSVAFKETYNVIVLNNGAFHKAKSLVIPENIGRLFLPPYSPELNSAKKMWAALKRKFTNKLHRTLEELSEFITNATATISKESIKKTCGFSSIFKDTILNHLIIIIGKTAGNKRDFCASDEKI